MSTAASRSMAIVRTSMSRNSLTCLRSYPRQTMSKRNPGGTNSTSSSVVTIHESAGRAGEGLHAGRVKTGRQLHAHGAGMEDLKRERSLYRSLSGVSAAGTGEQGLVEALHAVTGLPALVEDRFGNLRAWAGPGQPDEYPKPGPQQRREFLCDVTRRGPVVRFRDRLVALAHTHDDMLGVLALVDVQGTAGRLEVLALEHGVARLVGELRHQHDMVELERRLRGDLVADLLDGAAGDTAYARSRAVDHDLQAPHHVVAIRWDEADGVLCRAAEHAAASLGVRKPCWPSTSGRRRGLLTGRPSSTNLVSSGCSTPVTGAPRSGGSCWTGSGRCWTTTHGTVRSAAST